MRTKPNEIFYGLMAILTAAALASCLWFDLSDRQDRLRAQLDNRLADQAGLIRRIQ